MGVRRSGEGIYTAVAGEKQQEMSVMSDLLVCGSKHSTERRQGRSVTPTHCIQPDTERQIHIVYI